MNELPGNHYKPLQGVGLGPHEEVRVQQQLDHCLEPGWCGTRLAGQERKTARKQTVMLWWVAGVLMLLGIVGLFSNFPTGELISIGLVLVVGIAVIGLISSVVIAAKNVG